MLRAPEKVPSPNTPPQNTAEYRRPSQKNTLLEGDETGRVGGTDTGATVTDGLAVRVVSTANKLLSDSKVGLTKRWRTRRGSGRPSQA